MGLKFRKRVKLFPGCSINLSRSGASATFGPKGCYVNVGKSGSYLNVGLPGTGLYDRIRLDDPDKNGANRNASSPPFRDGVRRSVVKRRVEFARLNSSRLRSLQARIAASLQERADAQNRLSFLKRTRCVFAVLRFLSIVDFTGSVRRALTNRVDATTRELDALETTLDAAPFQVDFPIASKFTDEYRRLTEAFRKVSGSRVVWNESSENGRAPVSIGGATLNFVREEFNAPFIEDVSEIALHFYPSFLVLTSNSDFALIDWRDLQIDGRVAATQEIESVPDDAQVIGQIWLHANKDGTPDRRFKENFATPIVEYFYLSLRTNAGLAETFTMSSVSLGHEFLEALERYRTFWTSNGW